MIEGLISGTLVGLAETRQGKNGSSYVLAKVKASSADGDGIIVKVIAFAAQPGEALMALDDGDAVSVAGSVAPKVWTDKAGNVRPAMDMIAGGVLTLYQLAQKRIAIDPPDSRGSGN
ncbi:MAG: single-stranded DNA-binding protein [Rhodoferax sp.]